MNGAGGISGSRERRFNDEELDAMRRDDSTSAIVNRARRDAGYKEPDVAVRGDDKTLERVLDDQRTHVAKGEAALAAIHAIDVGEAIGVAIPGMHALREAPCILLPVAALVAAHIGMIDMEHTKAAMKDGATRDQLHAAVLDTIDVPEGFRARAMKELDVRMTAQSTAYKTGRQLVLADKPLAATLQLHCDQGMNAARRMVEAGTSKEAFLKANPEVAKRYAEDAAFHYGFDALAWAQKDSPATYKAEIAKLDSRDARYDAAHIACRI